MAATSTTVMALVGLALVASASDPVTEFGPNLWSLVIALDVINTVIVVFYLWRIWTKKELPIPRRTRGQGA